MTKLEKINQNIARIENNRRRRENAEREERIYVAFDFLRRNNDKTRRSDAGVLCERIIDGYITVAQAQTIIDEKYGIEKQSIPKKILSLF